MSFRLLLLACLGLICRAEVSKNIEYMAVCDAGSTGTRLYVFRLSIAEAEAKAVFVKKTKPGLSSYADNPAAAAAPLLKLLIEGAEKVPEDVRSKTSLAIFATAGMRMLSPERQQPIWEAVASLRSNPSYPFAADQFQARTITGSEEGLWALYNANFLTGRMSHTLLSHGKAQPLGLMDLGGSSTQIVVPAANAAKQGVHFGQGVLVHSYLGFGMTYIREQIRKDSSSNEDVVCYMRGYVIEEGIEGTGDAKQCRDLIRNVVARRSSSCRNSPESEKPCLGDLSDVSDATDAISGKVDFYAVAGMTYVVDFVHWWLKLDSKSAAAEEAFTKAYPRPNLRELSMAIDRMCAGEYKPVELLTSSREKAHPFTGFDNAPFRCFQANYIVVLLENTYGFPSDGRSITFLLDIDGEDLEWPLGAALDIREQAKGATATSGGIKKEL